MPGAYRIVPQLNLMIATYRGAVGLDDQARTMMAYRLDPAFRADQHVLIDFAHCTMEDLRHDAMQKVSQRIRKNFPDRGITARHAIYAPDAVTFQVVQVLKAMLSTAVWDVEVFRDRIAALDWLELDRSRPEYRVLEDEWLRQGDGLPSHP
ncbi:hypothetical protein [Sagittula salina]|uniref:Uncharacterized protein n=1 Tax=Sagittula salina TaxID=2820268 RepID=A0A940MMV4_9RHOB|nr:hypothetical protein [Sagittula salina]MBP0482229.1 hypothetical protein [Sagittula salina]